MRIALKYRTPVILLTDGYLANGAEPWNAARRRRAARHLGAVRDEPNHDDEFWPYLRDPETLARPWAIPGTPGLMHRIGGIEKEDGTGNISYDPENHELMVRIRAARSRGIANDIPPVDVDGDDGADVPRARLGGHVGRVSAAVRRVRARGAKVAHAHLVHLQPVPRRPRRRAARYPKVLVPEMNLGQLSKLVRAEFLVDAQSPHQGAGHPVHARPRSRPRSWR